MRRSTTTNGVRFWMMGMVLATVCLSGCGSSSYTHTIDRSTLVVSDNSKMASRTLVPQASKYPEVVQQLGLAQEVYLRQLGLLKGRRAEVRSRKRFLNAGSFGTMALTAAGVSGAAMFAGEDDATLQGAGTAALIGLTVGTGLQVASAMQEDPESVDSKLQQLDALYSTMIETLRRLAFHAQAAPAGPDGAREREQMIAQMGAVIESFMSSALSIHVKG